MTFAGKVWRLLVGIKDGLALVFLLLFFVALYMVLSSRPSPAEVREGALLLDLDGYVVEERTRVDPIQLLISQQAPVGEYRVRDLVHAIDTAASDERIEAVVLDLNGFLGGGHVHLQEVGAALDRVRVAGKPVLTHAMGYSDDSMMLAAHASEIWLEPKGAVLIAGPGGTALFYKELIDNLSITANIYRAGTFKAAIEPYSRTDFSPEARENYQSLQSVLWEEWQANVKKARPSADIALATTAPDEWIAASGGDFAEAALAAGLVDKLGGKVEFGERVAEIVGQDPWDDLPGSYPSTDLDAWLADNEPDEPGDAIGVITVAGEIIDGEAGPGIAGGNRIARLLDEALADDELKGLVVRVDSPGGTMTAAEEITRAIQRHKDKDIPIAASMANIATSGGYQVVTPADRIFAEPESLTGSIGVFVVFPTFEGTAREIGITTDSIRTSPLSGQPGVFSGLTPEMDAIIQSGVDNSYDDFISAVASSRGMTKEAVDGIGQGRVWDGGTARQIGLVDQYGGLDDALAWVASQANLEEGEWHARFLGDEDSVGGSFLTSVLFGESATASIARDPIAMLARRQANWFDRIAGDMERFMQVRGTQAYCLECPPLPRASHTNLENDTSFWSLLSARIWGQ